VYRIAFAAACLGALLIFGVAVATDYPTHTAYVRVTPDDRFRRGGEVIRVTFTMSTTQQDDWKMLIIKEPPHMRITSIVTDSGRLQTAMDGDSLQAMWVGTISGEPTTLTVTLRLDDPMPTGVYDLWFGVYEGGGIVEYSAQFLVGNPIYIPIAGKRSCFTKFYCPPPLNASIQS
jgi:hypothetical protein